MAKYLIETDGGKYEVETEESSPLQEGLKTTGDILGGAFKRQLKTGPTSFNTITGGPATEFAHQVKMEALKRTPIPEYPIGEVGVGGGNLHEAIASGTDPQAFAPESLVSARLNAVPGAIERLKAMQTSAKGRATVSRLLPAANIAEDVQAGRPSGVQVEGFNLIKKSKNPMDIFNAFKNEKNKVISNVDEIIKANNKPVSPEKIRLRVQEILGKQFSNSSDDEIRALNDAMSEELSKLPHDAVSANARKRFLYEKTQNIQKAQRQGKTIVTRPEQALVDDAFAQAYKEAIEEVAPVKEENARFGGLEEGSKASSKLVEGELEQTPQGERIASQTAGRPSIPSMLAALVRELPFIGSSPKRLTGLIEKLRIKHGELLLKAREKQAPRLIGKEFTKVTPDIPESKPFVPYGLEGGQAGSGRFPEVQPEAPYTPYGIPGGGKAGKVKEVVRPNQPYGESLPYKTPKMKQLARRKK